MLCKTEWSWELRTWSHKMNLPDILSTSLHYFCRKWIGATNDNSKFDLRFKGLIMSKEWVFRDIINLPSCSCRKGNFQSEVSESFISFLYGIVSDFLSSKSKIKLIHFTFYKLLLLKKDQISTVGLFTKSSAWIYYCVIIAAGRSCHKMAKMPYTQFQEQLIKSVKLCNNYQLRSASDSVEMT